VPCQFNLDSRISGKKINWSGIAMFRISKEKLVPEVRDKITIFSRREWK